MAKYRLKAGQHEQADKGRPKLDALGNPTGRFEVKKFRPGETVESDADLVTLFGSEKFELVGCEDQARRIAELERELANLRGAQARSSGDDGTGGFRVAGDPTPENLRNNPATFPGGQVSTGFQGGSDRAADNQGATRFEAERGDRDAGGEAADDGLEDMTVPELKKLAEDEEIDLKGAHLKADVLRAVRRGRSGR
jgi:hypothetical protein